MVEPLDFTDDGNLLSVIDRLGEKPHCLYSEHFKPHWAGIKSFATEDVL